MEDLPGFLEHAIVAVHIDQQIPGVEIRPYPGPVNGRFGVARRSEGTVGQEEAIGEEDVVVVAKGEGMVVQDAGILQAGAAAQEVD
jgi:hypothetical protein